MLAAEPAGLLPHRPLPELPDRCWCGRRWCAATSCGGCWPRAWERVADAREAEALTVTGRARVKVCCIASVEEARLAIGTARRRIGLVSAMPSGPGPIDEALIARDRGGGAARRSAPSCSPAARPSTRIVAQQRRTRVNTIQICDDLPAGSHRACAPRCRASRSCRSSTCDGDDASAAARGGRAGGRRDPARLGQPEARGQGAGRDRAAPRLEISRRIREAGRRPVYLAGGLTAPTSREAIAAVGRRRSTSAAACAPTARLDAARLAAFFAAVRALRRRRRLLGFALGWRWSASRSSSTGRWRASG